MRTLAHLIHCIEALNETIGRVVSWLLAAMVVTIFTVVLLRYGFSTGWVWLQESYVWMHGLVFMLGAGYTLHHNAHVRIDIFYRPGGARYRAWVDLGGSLFLLLPTVVLIFTLSYPYVADSWARLESSREAGGLPGLFLLKSAILVFCFLFGAQGLALAGRSLLILCGRAQLLRLPPRTH